MKFGQEILQGLYVRYRGDLRPNDPTRNRILSITYVTAMQTLIFSLGRRGFFSEINNMAFCYIYARRRNYNFVVNSFFWNCRSRKGLRDYFDIPFAETTNLFSAQLLRTMNDSQVGVLRKCAFSFLKAFNRLYLLTHSGVILASSVFSEFRSPAFLSSITYGEYKEALTTLFKYSDEVKDIIERRKQDLGIDQNYVGVHIRRGDKITTGEMQNINLERYAQTILSSNYKTAYIASDDLNVVNLLRENLSSKGIRIFSSPKLKENGFVEMAFNKKHRNERVEETLNLLFDIEMLANSSYFIGTFSSNLSRVIPVFVGIKNCVSLDLDWFVG